MKPTYRRSCAGNHLMFSDLTPPSRSNVGLLSLVSCLFGEYKFASVLRCIGRVVIAPGWPGMPWFWDLVQLSTDIPLQLPVSTTLLKQSHNYVFHSNPQHLNLQAWCLGVDSSKNKASL